CASQASPWAPSDYW
nr:immunoglobulin heavy chain junction region [Mus musculus]